MDCDLPATKFDPLFGLKRKCLVHVQLGDDYLEDLYPGQTTIEQVYLWAQAKYGDDFIGLQKHYFADGTEIEIVAGEYGMWAAKIAYWRICETAKKVDGA